MQLEQGLLAYVLVCVSTLYVYMRMRYIEYYGLYRIVHMCKIYIHI